MDQHHPDRNGSSPNDKQAQRILEAWEVLRDPTKRKQYDAELSGNVFVPLTTTTPLLTLSM